jgi:hypothetical protein
MLSNPDWEKPSKDELIEALSALYETGCQVHVPDKEVSRAAYRGEGYSHGIFTMDCRPKDMRAFNKRLSEARAILERAGRFRVVRTKKTKK